MRGFDPARWPGGAQSIEGPNEALWPGGGASAPLLALPLPPLTEGTLQGISDDRVRL